MSNVLPLCRALGLRIGAIRQDVKGNRYIKVTNGVNIIEISIDSKSDLSYSNTIKTVMEIGRKIKALNGKNLITENDIASVNFPKNDENLLALTDKVLERQLKDSFGRMKLENYNKITGMLQDNDRYNSDHSIEVSTKVDGNKISEVVQGGYFPMNDKLGELYEYVTMVDHFTKQILSANANNLLTGEGPHYTKTTLTHLLNGEKYSDDVRSFYNTGEQIEEEVSEK